MLDKIRNILKLKPASNDAKQIITSSIPLDYPICVRKRPLEGTSGGRQIAAILEQSKQECANLLQAMVSFHPALRLLPVSDTGDGVTPFWNNPWIPPLDAMSIYTLVRALKPATYFEVGSGTSTKFARRAILDGALQTKIISVDPAPRAEIDGLCDEVIREKFEDLTASTWLDRIKPGDLVFIDNSHRSFQSSDVTVFFTEMLPSLPLGLTWGLHDIFLPFDYPEQWLGRFYNEQYMLAAYLLGGHSRDKVIFPAAYCAQNNGVAATLDQALHMPALIGLQRDGGCFWMRRIA